MRYSRKADAVGTIHIDQAARYGKPGGGVGGIDGHFILNVAHAREVRLPEPVTWRGLNGRDPEGWEEPLIRSARERERRVELALLAGTLGQP